MKQLGIWLIVLGLMAGPLVTVASMVMTFAGTTTAPVAVPLALSLSMYGIPIVVLGAVLFIIGVRRHRHGRQ